MTDARTDPPTRRRRPTRTGSSPADDFVRRAARLAAARPGRRVVRGERRLHGDSCANRCAPVDRRRARRARQTPTRARTTRSSSPFATRSSPPARSRRTTSRSCAAVRSRCRRSFVDCVVAAIVHDCSPGATTPFERRAASSSIATQRVGAAATAGSSAGDLDALDHRHATAGFGEIGRLLARGRRRRCAHVDARALGRQRGRGAVGAARPRRVRPRPHPRGRERPRPRPVLHDDAQPLGHAAPWRASSSAGSPTSSPSTTRIRPLQRIDDPAWSWHVGLDVRGDRAAQRALPRRVARAPTALQQPARPVSPRRSPTRARCAPTSPASRSTSAWRCSDRHAQAEAAEPPAQPAARRHDVSRARSARRVRERRAARRRSCSSAIAACPAGESTQSAKRLRERRLDRADGCAGLTTITPYWLKRRLSPSTRIVEVAAVLEGEPGAAVGERVGVRRRGDVERRPHAAAAVLVAGDACRRHGRRRPASSSAARRRGCRCGRRARRRARLRGDPGERRDDVVALRRAPGRSSARRGRSRCT